MGCLTVTQFEFSRLYVKPEMEPNTARASDCLTGTKLKEEGRSGIAARRLPSGLLAKRRKVTAKRLADGLAGWLKRRKRRKLPFPLLFSLECRRHKCS